MVISRTPGTAGSLPALTETLEEECVNAWKFYFWISFLRLSIYSYSLFFSFLSLFNSSCTSLTLAFCVLAVIGLSGSVGLPPPPPPPPNDCIQFLSSFVTIDAVFLADKSLSFLSLSYLFSSSRVCMRCFRMFTSSLPLWDDRLLSMELDC